MHVNTKTTALLGVLAAFSVVLMLLGNVITINTLFFLIAAAFIVGIVVREKGAAVAVIFMIVCATVGFFVLPQKMHCLTYLGFSIYVWCNEFFYVVLDCQNKGMRAQIPYWIIKAVVFNAMFIPTTLLLPRLLMPNGFPLGSVIITIVLGQVAFVIFDLVYVWFQFHIWNGLRKKIFR